MKESINQSINQRIKRPTNESIKQSRVVKVKNQISANFVVKLANVAAHLTFMIDVVKVFPDFRLWRLALDVTWGIRSVYTTNDSAAQTAVSGKTNCRTSKNLRSHHKASSFVAQNPSYILRENTAEKRQRNSKNLLFFISEKHNTDESQPEVRSCTHSRR